MFNSVGTIKVAFSSSRFWMNLLFVAGTCGIIDFFILGFNYIYNPSSAKELQILINKSDDMDKISTNELPKKVRKKIESYNEYNGEDENLKKEVTQRKSNNNIDELRLKPKNGGSSTNSHNLENFENGIVIQDKHNKINSELDDSRKNTTIKDNKYLDNKIVKKRNNYAEIEASQSIENSNNVILDKKAGENKNINNQKKNLINDNKNDEYFGNNDVMFYNQEHSNKAKMKDDDNHSRSALILNKKGCVDDINGSITKQNNNKSIYI
jgi:hypothetical protein